MSINVQELRKGNLILRMGLFESVVSINLSRVNGSMAKYFDPIPLTSELLVKFGFTPNAQGVLSIELWDMATHLEVMETTGTFYTSIDQQQDIGTPQNVALQHILYLHELQNLYFCLCGSELTINITK